MTPEEKRRAYEEWKARKRPEPQDVAVIEPPAPAPAPLVEPELTPEEAEKRRRNRERHPDVAAFLDNCRRYFGDVEVVSLEER